MNKARILIGDVRETLATLPAGSVQCVVTSPPYWGLRDYGVSGQIGQEATPAEYVETMVGVFREVWRVLRGDGTVWLNVGDSYARPAVKGGSGTPNGRNLEKMGYTGKKQIPDGLKEKDLCLIPWRLAIALQEEGWYVRSAICWAKKAPMPESTNDRPTSSWEPIFLLAKNAKYFYDKEAVKEPAERGAAGSRFDEGKTAINGMGRAQIGDREESGTRNQRNVWHLGPEPFSEWVKTSRQVRVASDDACDGMARKSSEDCPVHGKQDRRDDEHEGCPSIHNHDTCDCLDQEPHHEPDTNSERPVPSMSASSSDSQSQPCATSAKPRSSQSRKTARVPETSPPCTPCVETADGTGCTPKSPVSSVEDRDIDENTIFGDDSGDNRGNQTPGGNADTQDELGVSEASYRSYVGKGCTCSFYKTITGETSHFAVFPSEIPRRAILAGTSERGACPTCGAPWVRVVEKTQLKRERPNEYTKRTGENGTGNSCANDVAGVEVITTGWQPSCTCPPAEPVPCVVLDPFGGSGTTGVVALELGRDAILCELNPEYAAMARRRLDRVDDEAALFTRSGDE